MSLQAEGQNALVLYVNACFKTLPRDNWTHPLAVDNSKARNRWRVRK